jgi:asparagine synthase (glutamine-hydrolysing)
MSAIFGLINLDGRPAAEHELDVMGAALAEHGPDGNGIWTGGHIGFGQRLMCFTPEDRLERQPVSHAGGQYVLVSDARIDNRLELTHELGILPTEARELPDSTFILRAWEKWGDDCPRHLIGAFVFALYDAREQTVLIARSQMGERSLFYYETPRLFAFASAPKGLFALPFVPREINPQSVADFLVHMPKEPGSSFFLRINTLQPGHSIVVRRGGFQSRQYRALDIQSETRFQRDSDYVDAFKALFDRVIADQMRSLTPVGVSMSGGLDSSAIAASAALTFRQRNERLHTFTEVPRAGFQGPVPKGKYADEAPYVEAMARKYDNLDVHFVRSDGRFYLDELDRFFTVAEAPLRRASNWIWMEAILQEAQRRNVRILLTGVPGNLTVSWGGAGLLPELLCGRKWRRALHEARALAAHGAARSTLGILTGQGLMPLLPDWLRLVVKHLRTGFRGFPTRPWWHEYSPIRPEFASAQRVDERARENGHDFHFRFPSAARAAYVIRQADARGDARRGKEALLGVQERDPAADMRLVEFCFSLPEAQYLRDGESRWLIRRAMADRLPAEVLNNRRRGLQAADWLESMRAARARIEEEFDTLEKSALASNAIDLGRMRRLVDQIQDVRSDQDQTVLDYRGVLDHGMSMGRFIAWVEGG